MIELHDTDGYKIAFDPEKVECVQETEIMYGKFATLCFTSGNRILVDEDYEKVKRMLNDVLTAEV